MSVRTDQLVQHARRALDAGRISEAKALCDRLLLLAKKNPAALLLMGQTLTAAGRFDEAVPYLERCAKLAPREVEVHLALAEAETKRGRYGLALIRYDRALRLQPKSPWAITGKAQVLHRRGEDERAVKLLEPFVQSGEENAAMAVVVASSLNRIERQEEAVRLLEKHLAAPGTSDADRAALNLLLGRVHEARGAYDLAFAAFDAGNRAYGTRDDPEKYRRHVDEIIEVFSAARLPSLPRADHGLDTPVLVVGMPRCGSTLVEQILDAHPQASGAGEHVAMVNVLRDTPMVIGSTLPYPACVRDMNRRDASELGRRYVAMLSKGRTRAPRIIDKYLPNYENLGLLSCIVPEARVIDCRRDPVDTCLSCFALPLSPVIHPYACDLVSLGRRYRQYERLMEHWTAVLDIRMMRVQYEDLVADSENMIPRLVEFAGLPWDDCCLKFHESRRDALTFSRDQVRRPIYRDSMKRADRFGPHLDPLRRALAAEDAP